jgi:serine/threonine protein kinase
VLRGDWTDRVVAEIDQDGYVIAADERDTAFFGTNQSMHPMRYNRVQVVLRGGRIYLRKSFISAWRPNNKMAAILDSLRWGFYLEAAALLRLRGLNGVPQIRRIEARNGAIEMDYIWGRDLRQILSAGRKINDEEIYRSFKALLASDNEISRQVRAILSGMVERGVIYRDLKPPNALIAECSHRLYIIDFQDALLRARKI